MLSSYDTHQLLLLEPKSPDESRDRTRFKQLKDYWLILGKIGVTSVQGRDTVSLHHCYWMMLAQFLLDEIDLAFDENNQLPQVLPDDLTPYENVLIYAEEFEHHVQRLEQDFPDARAYVRQMDEQPHIYRFTPSSDGKRRLYVRPLRALTTPGKLGQIYWSMGLNPGSQSFRDRQTARPTRHVFQQTIDKLLDGLEDPHWHQRYPPIKCGQIMGNEWTENTTILLQQYFALGDLLNEPRFPRIAEAAVHRYFDQVDWRALPKNADQFGIISGVACLYEKTREPKLLELIQLRFKQHENDWGQWRGCYGNWPAPPDEWLRDSSLFNNVSAGVLAASKLGDEATINKQKIYEHAVHQVKVTDELLRDPQTGWYRFGADGQSRMAPSFATHGSYWHMYAYALLLEHLPKQTPGYDTVHRVFESLATAMLSAQGPTGMWHTHLDRLDDGMGDAGYTAAITGALLAGIRLGLLDRNTFEPAALRGIDGYKVRCFDGYLVGGVVACGLSPSPRYYYSRNQHEELLLGTWHQLYLMVEALRYGV